MVILSLCVFHHFQHKFSKKLIAKPFYFHNCVSFLSWLAISNHYINCIFKEKSRESLDGTESFTFSGSYSHFTIRVFLPTIFCVLHPLSMQEIIPTVIYLYSYSVKSCPFSQMYCNHQYVVFI